MTEMLPDAAVVIENCHHDEYPDQPPFHPAQIFPEYPYPNRETQPDNWVYGHVREALHQLGLDATRFGLPTWNPFGTLIPVGGRVVIKPNLVISEHELGDPGVIASVAHGSVIRAIADYALIAAGQTGRITICDSPIKEVDFAKIMRVTGLAGVLEYLKRQAGSGPTIELLDIRDLQAFRDERGTIVDWVPLPGDPRGYTVVDLGEKSFFCELGDEAHRLRSTAAVYEDEASVNHGPAVNRYSFPNTILEADCIISVAKLKVHRKCGVTLSLKNMVGTTNEKRWLPHHRAGTPRIGGDMCPDDAPPDRKLNEFLADKVSSHRYGYAFRRFVLPVALLLWKALHLKSLMRVGRSNLHDWREGDWYGNDTIWRTVLDLNTALGYADERGMYDQHPAAQEVQRHRWNHRRRS